MAAPRMTRQQRRVAMATTVGTTIEWYDFFIYANAVALVFGQLFFSPLEGPLQQLVPFATIGISFLVRPLGAVLMGRLGDRYGRRVVLIVTLVMMGAATTLIGLLPTYAAIGVAAPILLVLLRVVQGFSAGGEWAGAALMAVEHAPADKRGRFGSFPQLGVPAGMLLAAAVSAAVIAPLGEERYLEWGWRIPFLLSIVLLALGHYIRRKVEESPVFAEMEQSAATEHAPLSTLFRRHPVKVLQASLVFMGNNGAGYMLVGGYLLNYGTTKLGLDSSLMLNMIMAGSVAWFASTWYGAVLSDRLGRPRTIGGGYGLLLLWLFPMFLLIGTGEAVLVLLALVVFGLLLGLSYGALSAMYAEHFPASIRLSGASISYALGAILGGAFVPTISVWLEARFDSVLSVAAYLAVLVAVSGAVALTFADRRGADLSHRGDEDAPAPAGHR
ncbi:MFS transporter [Nocardiopsis composta]|uniref:Putative proline/betaine transporter n=1 Tax=Nocardiopsis composta TaxID=157465 RepID=A0A7W8QHD1_9ACTN|nr:MFS transporter [Nocardiopsis composta]MBB5430249.1 MFS family permease [Nocardiopsis composta]